jgi:PAS domain S-box-containing protein
VKDEKPVDSAPDSEVRSLGGLERVAGAPGCGGSQERDPQSDWMLRRCQRLQALINSVFDASYDWHIQTGIIEFSSQLEAFLGLEPNSLTNYQGWAERLHPDDRDRAVAGTQDAALTRGAYTDEYRLRRGDGTYAVVSDRGVTLVDEMGRPTHMVGAMRDVTRERETERVLRESAELYQMLFHKAAHPAFQVSEDGCYLDANAAGLAFLGSSREELLGKSILDHWGTEAANALKDVMSRADSAVGLSTQVRTKGSVKSVIVSVASCHVGGQLACFLLATDITDQHALQHALEESNIALRVILEQRNRDREEFERTILLNMEQMVLPLLERIAPRIARAPEAAFLDTAMDNLRQIMQPISQSLDSGGGEPLTLREREIAGLIRAGKSSAEIAAALYISTGTVAFHRKNLRRKLGLAVHGPRLASHLVELTSTDPRAHS